MSSYKKWNVHFMTERWNQVKVKPFANLIFELKSIRTTLGVTVHAFTTVRQNPKLFYWQFTTVNECKCI